jgi:hypothetical protein
MNDETDGRAAFHFATRPLTIVLYYSKSCMFIFSSAFLRLIFSRHPKYIAKRIIVGILDVKNVERINPTVSHNDLPAYVAIPNIVNSE